MFLFFLIGYMLVGIMICLSIGVAILRLSINLTNGNNVVSAGTEPGPSAGQGTDRRGGR